MTNHYHVVLSSELDGAVSMAIGQVNREYSLIRHALMGTKGQLWQGRFGSCVLDEAHFWAALCYVEQNPVSAGMVNHAWEWEWSSARLHLGMVRDCWLDLERWRERFSEKSWHQALEVGIRDQALEERIAMGKIWYQQNPVTRHRLGLGIL